LETAVTDQRDLLFSPPADDSERRRQEAEVTRRLSLLRIRGLIMKIPHTQRSLLARDGTEHIRSHLAWRETSLKSPMPAENPRRKTPPSAVTMCSLAKPHSMLSGGLETCPPALQVLVWLEVACVKLRRASNSGCGGCGRISASASISQGGREKCRKPLRRRVFD